DSNDTKRGLLYFQPGDETVRLDARNSAGTAGQGKLNLLGNPVMVNGTSIGDMFIHRAVNADNLAVVGGGNISGNINASYSGYKPLIATCDVENASSSGSGSSGTVAYYCHLDGNKVFYWVHNHNSTQAKIKVNVFVLYVKN
ncbi:MAG: hypothetical protein IJ105_01125, partial [Bacilli bacterium]|nr:hypothetical protein [Bacilli bacterium]